MNILVLTNILGFMYTAFPSDRILSYSDPIRSLSDYGTRLQSSPRPCPRRQQWLRATLRRPAGITTACRVCSGSNRYQASNVSCVLLSRSSSQSFLLMIIKSWPSVHRFSVVCIWFIILLQPGVAHRLGSAHPAEKINLFSCGDALYPCSLADQRAARFHPSASVGRRHHLQSAVFPYPAFTESIQLRTEHGHTTAIPDDTHDSAEGLRFQERRGWHDGWRSPALSARQARQRTSLRYGVRRNEGKQQI